MKNWKPPSAREASRPSGDSFGGGIVEACWLAALAVVLLAYDPHNVAGYQWIKISLLRTLGLITAGALTLRWLQRPRVPADRPAHAPSWCLPLAALTGVSLLASVFSLEPASSFLGSPEFLEGFFTLLCTAALFVGVATTLRTKIQFERLVSVALAASVPVCLYALLQWARMDPAFVSDGSEFEPGRPAGSLAGHPIYLAGSLIMLMPLSLWRIWSIVQANGSLGRRMIGPGVIMHGLVFLLQLAAFVSAEKRGPFIALVVAAFCGCVLLGALTQKFRLVIWAAAIAALVVIALAILAALGKPGSPVEKIPIIRSLARIIPVGSGGSDPYRKAVWSQGPKIAASSVPFVFPDGRRDEWHLLRPLIGYGPETTAGVLTKQWLFIANGPEGRVESRFHNLFWDVWATMGLAGLAAMVWFYLRLLRFGISGTGLTEPPALNWRALLAAGLLGGSTAAVWGLGFFGVGFQLGLVLGVVGTVFLRATKAAEDSAHVVTSQSAAALALTTALIAHWIDMGFAFPTGSTTMLFWILGGATVALTSVSAPNWPESAREQNGKSGGHDHSVNRVPSGILEGVLAGMMLMVLFHGFIHYATFKAAGLGEILFGALTQVQYDKGPSLLLPVVFFPAWLAVAYLLTCSEGSSSKPLGRPGKAFLFATALSLVIGCGYALLKSWWLVQVGPIPQVTASVRQTLEQGAGFAALNLFFFVAVITLTLVIAAVIFVGCGKQARPKSWHRSSLAVTAVCLLGGWVFWLLVIPVLRCSAYEGWGQVTDSAERYALAAAAYQKGLEISPRHLTTRLECSAAFLNAAMAARSKSGYEDGMREAEQTLEQGRKYSEFHFINYYLGRIRLLRAIRAPDKAGREEWTAKAEEAYQRALVFAPQNETALTELAILAELSGNDKVAADYRVKAAAVTASFNPIPWAEFYANQSFSALDPVLKTGYARHAITLFERADLLAPQGKLIESEKRDLYRRLVTEGTLRRTLRQLAQARACFERASELLPPKETWQADAMMAQTYLDLGDKQKAFPLIEKALRSAPSEAIDSLNSLKEAASQ